jgi:hypothetical protein
VLRQFGITLSLAALKQKHRVAPAHPSFLKRRQALCSQKFFGSSFQKRTAFLALGFFWQ